MEIGISTSCLYPMETEKAAMALAELGTPVTEVFLNTVSEMDEEFLKKIKTLSDAKKMRIVSLHPCTSFAEPYFLFSDYERRFYDGLAFYRRYFEVAKYLGAKFLVLHGDWKTGCLKEAEYFRRYEALMKEGTKYGVDIAQENVNRYRSESPSFLLQMKKAFGKDFHMVFDIKQSVRAGYNPLAFMEALGSNVAHVHISDHTAQEDCLPPGKGNFNFMLFFDLMHKLEYRGDFVIELYRKNYAEIEEIQQAKLYLDGILKKLNFI